MKTNFKAAVERVQDLVEKEMDNNCDNALEMLTLFMEIHLTLLHQMLATTDEMTEQETTFVRSSIAEGFFGMMARTQRRNHTMMVFDGGDDEQ